MAILLDTIKKPVARGTCFFIKKGEDYFLITNRHIVSGEEMYDTTPYVIANFNYLTFRYTNKEGEYVIDTIDLSGLPKESPVPHYYQVPDIYVVKVDLPQGSMLNCLDFYDAPMPPKEDEKYITQLFCFGYPDEGAWYTFSFKISIYLDKIQMSFADSNLKYDVEQYFFANYATRKGFSGSPVFAEYTKEGASKIYWVGIASGAFAIDNYSIILKQKVALEEIEKVTKE